MWLERERFEVFSKGWKWHKLGVIGKALWLPCWLNKNVKFSFQEPPDPGGGGGGTPPKYLYGYVPPNGVVILGLLI